MSKQVTCPHFPHMLDMDWLDEWWVEQEVDASLKADTDDHLPANKVDTKRSPRDIRHQGYSGEYAVARLYGWEWEPDYGMGKLKAPDLGWVEVKTITVSNEHEDGKRYRGLGLTPSDISMLRRTGARVLLVLRYIDTSTITDRASAMTVWGWTTLQDIEAHAIRTPGMTSYGFRVLEYGGEAGAYLPLDSKAWHKTCIECSR